MKPSFRNFLPQLVIVVLLALLVLLVSPYYLFVSRKTPNAAVTRHEPGYNGDDEERDLP